LVRLPNGLVAAAAVLVGARWAGAGWGNLAVWSAAASAVSLTALANAYNDYQDRYIDTLNHPERPIPSGELDAEEAKEVATLAGILAVPLAFLAHPGLGVLSLGVIIAMVAYGDIKAWSGVAGNIVVTVIGALPFLYGAWAAGNPGSAWPFMALAAPLQFGREVAKDLDDARGDWEASRPTLPNTLGWTVARRVGAAAAAVAVGVLVLIGVRVAPSIGLWLLPAGLVVLLGCWQLLHGAMGRLNPLLPSNLFKLGMVLAILPLLLLHP
jgi:geranylgeranylglycerol-phosphate geranylgeranyltransferase